jgi:hypothetical protein
MNARELESEGVDLEAGPQQKGTAGPAVARRSVDLSVDMSAGADRVLGENKQAAGTQNMGVAHFGEVVQPAPPLARDLLQHDEVCVGLGKNGGDVFDAGVVVPHIECDHPHEAPAFGPAKGRRTLQAQHE